MKARAAEDNLHVSLAVGRECSLYGEGAVVSDGLGKGGYGGASSGGHVRRGEDLHAVFRGVFGCFALLLMEAALVAVVIEERPAVGCVSGGTLTKATVAQGHYKQV